MIWWQAFLANITSVTAVVAVLAYLAKNSIEQNLSNRIEEVKHLLKVDESRRDALIKSQISFKERQLSEFYGPIYAELKRGQPIYGLWTAGRLHEIEKDVCELFVKSNDAITQLLLTKSHLIRGDTIPKSFTDFLTHVAVWHAFLRTEHGGIPLSVADFPEAYFPIPFREEIFATTEALKRELDTLYRTYGLESS